MTTPDNPILHGWLRHVMESSVPMLRSQVDEFGTPVFGLAGALATEGELGGTLGGAPNRGIVLRYGRGTSQIEVTTGRYPLGGTWILLRRILELAASPDATLPFSVSATERLLMLPFEEGRSQFRVVEASSGHWIAVGGRMKRHLKIEGYPWTAPEGLSLTEVVLP